MDVCVRGTYVCVCLCTGPCEWVGVCIRASARHPTQLMPCVCMYVYVCLCVRAVRPQGDRRQATLLDWLLRGSGREDMAVSTLCLEVRIVSTGAHI